METQYVVLEQILNEIQTISESYERVAEATGENFNIFSILQMESDEVATHSRFIAELLNRKGTHGQKDKFLSNFIKLFAPESKLDTQNSQVIVEHHIGKVEGEEGGRIDILVKDNSLNTISIENKIYASEQHDQLLRYHSAFPNGKLFYLTLFGENSKEKSSKDVTYTCISYETDIINWLEECKKDSVNIPILRETISQYINLLKKLTNQNLNKKMNQDIISRVLRDKDSLNACVTLFKAFKGYDYIEKGLKNDVIDKIKTIFKQKGFYFIKTKDFPGQIDFQTQTLKDNHLRLALRFTKTYYTGLIIGFVNENAERAKDPKLLELFNKEFSNAIQTEWWNAYIAYKGYENWDFSFLSKVCFDENDKFLKDLESKIDKMLKIIEARLAQE